MNKTSVQWHIGKPTRWDLSPSHTTAAILKRLEYTAKHSQTYCTCACKNHIHAHTPCQLLDTDSLIHCFRCVSSVCHTVYLAHIFYISTFNHYLTRVMEENHAGVWRRIYLTFKVTSSRYSHLMHLHYTNTHSNPP